MRVCVFKKKETKNSEHLLALFFSPREGNVKGKRVGVKNHFEMETK